jgi:hypothetical protein
VPIEPIQLALDQNFPEPILQLVAPFMPEVQLVPLRAIDARLPDMDDRPLVLALAQLGWAGLVTNNYRMLQTPSEVAAIMRAKIGIFAVEGTGDDPVRATGAVLLDLPGVLKDFQPGRGGVFWMRPRRPRRVEARQVFDDAAARQGLEPTELYQQVRVTDDEMNPLD